MHLYVTSRYSKMWKKPFSSFFFSFLRFVSFCFSFYTFFIEFYWFNYQFCVCDFRFFIFYFLIVTFFFTRHNSIWKWNISVWYVQFFSSYSKTIWNVIYVFFLFLSQLCVSLSLIFWTYSFLFSSNLCKSSYFLFHTDPQLLIY